MLPNAILSDLFIEYNAPVASTAAVDCVFPLRQHVLKSKGCGLSDRHFEMLVFLHGKKTAYFIVASIV